MIKFLLEKIFKDPFVKQGDIVSGELMGAAAHDIRVNHKYIIHYPDHAPRQDDPHYVDFNHYHNKTRKTARCYVGERIGFDECITPQGEPATIDANGVQSGLELHHAHVEQALLNSVDLTALEVDYPGISNAEEVGKWAQSGKNFRWLCFGHHRGPGGAHNATHSDYEGAQYIKGLIS